MLMTMTPHTFDDLVAQTLPELQAVSPEHIPQPYRDLLVHEGDMTGRLESHYDCRIHLDTLEVNHDAQALYRLVLLRDEAERALEFGCIRINLDIFDEPARSLVLACHQPLGGILTEHEITFWSELQGFFTTCAEGAFRDLLGLSEPHRLYGRRNRLLCDRGVIADVVEILPP